MKIRVTLKDPDVLHEAIEEAVRGEVNTMLPKLDKSEVEDLVDGRSIKIADLCAKWFKYGEYITVEIDTKENTCVVVPAKG